MKKKLIVIIPLIIMVVLVGIYLFNRNNKVINKKPDLTQVRAICNLATLETYYHNVAKIEKSAGSGISHWFEKDRKLWIEYTGTAKIGIDMSKVNMQINEENITVTLPKAQLLSIDIKEISEESYMYSNDSWINKNEFTPEEETEAINIAQNKMKTNVENNSQLLLNAQSRAKDLIEQYLIQIGEWTDINYEITWVFE